MLGNQEHNRRAHTGSENLKILTPEYEGYFQNESNLESLDKSQEGFSKDGAITGSEAESYTYGNQLKEFWLERKEFVERTLMNKAIEIKSERYIITHSGTCTSIEWDEALMCATLKLKEGGEYLFFPETFDGTTMYGRACAKEFERMGRSVTILS